MYSEAFRKMLWFLSHQRRQFLPAAVFLGECFDNSVQVVVRCSTRCFYRFFLGCRMRFCSRVLTVGRKYQTLAVLRIKKSSHKEDEKTIFCGCGGLVLCFFGFNSRLPQFDCFPKSFAAKRKSDASIRKIVINRVYKRFPKAGGVLKAKPSLSANTVK